MKRWVTILAAAVFVVAANGAARLHYFDSAAAQADAGWVTLFDGNNLG